MKNITFTKNELAAVKCCLNYDSSDDIDDDRLGQLEDNYSNGGPEEFKQLHNNDHNHHDNVLCKNYLYISF